jgi:chemotaxis protein methyltransferase CheR
MNVATTAADLTRGEYELFRRLVYEKSGISLGDHKLTLVRARLGKRIREGGFRSYRAYFEYVKNDPSGRELCALIDAISTNTTHLFREKQHFDFLADVLAEWVADRGWRAAHRTIRLWSAACSSGEEPDSIAMTAHDIVHTYPDLQLKILATDISTRVLERAKAGLFEAHRLGTVPQTFRRRYLAPAQVDGDVLMQVAPELRRLITFAHFNLMAERFPFRYRFDAIFCRNVMIYFDRPTQQALVSKLVTHLCPGGYLLIGHSESLSAIEHGLRYVRPTVYQRPPA